VVATGVSAEDYMEHYAESHHEWVGGTVIKMSPVGYTHSAIVDYLKVLLYAYFALRPIGKVASDPFIMRLPGSIQRQPDLQIILGDNCDNLKETYMDGPADICVEVVSPGSVSTDYGAKLVEYEKGGVAEYWLIDPIRQVAHFYRLTERGVYEHDSPTEAYTTTRLPGLRVDIAPLWADPLPDLGTVWESVRAMLG
jgi:Uma2 family endonuclease